MTHSKLDSQVDSRPGLAWLVRLRWLSVLGQLVACLLGHSLSVGQIDLPLTLGLISALALSNGVLMWASKRSIHRPTALILGALGFDTAQLTCVLLATGGPMNPFSIYFIVHVALAGVMIGSRGAWAMAALTTLGFWMLFWLAPEDPHAHHHHHGHAADDLHLQGMWLAYAVAASLVAMFVSGIATALRASEREAAHLRERALEAERMASLAAFSASAAHELGTPLSTIAVIASELADTLDRDPRPEDREALVEDARLVRREVERCRTLLRDLSERAGTWAGEAPERLTRSQLRADLIEHLPIGGAARLQLSGFEGEEVLLMPRRSLVQSLANLVRNALEHSQAAVELHLESTSQVCRLVVRDRGPGFAPEVLARIGEPFNRLQSSGLGLGLHLARAFADKVGGRLLVSPRDGGGAEVALELPLTLGARDE